ncbi:MAG: energy transducer TonB [Elusimicrobia bacterium]|nr:energy transducer TonB [Elusimicrobiota bacterium]
MYSESSNKTLTYSAAGAVLFHGLLVFFYLNFVLLRPETGNIVISNVDLLMQEKTASAPKPKPVRNKTFDFLKLALPAIPKIEAAPAARLPTIDIKTPEARRTAVAVAQKLPERSGRLQAQEKLEMNTAKRAATVLNADLGIRAERTAVALAPRIELEEVGMKKAPPLPGGLKFDETARAEKPRTMQALNIAVERAKKISALPQGLAENTAAINPAGGLARVSVAMPDKIADAGGKKVELAAGLRKQPALTAAAFKNPVSEGIKDAQTPKKVEIEGPLSKRKVTAYYVPPFPDWAGSRGILEASAAVKFYVDNSGAVLDNVSVERSSGYGELDRLAIEAIKKWRFEPLPGAPSRQWGIITFRFVVE